jgi:hypothetical protein
MNNQPTVEQAIAVTIMLIGLAIFIPAIVKCEPRFSVYFHVGVEGK